MRKAIALLTFRPQRSQVNFYLEFEKLGYDLFVIVDDNGFDTSDWSARLLQIDDAQCAEQGFKHLNVVVNKASGCSAWDKAIYHFSSVDCSYDHVWFIEDDVFLSSHEPLVGIDKACPDADIVSESNVINLHGSRDPARWWWWPYVPSVLPAPWAHSMVCAVRMSHTMLATVRNLVETQRHALSEGLTGTHISTPWGGAKFPFIEFFFHTLAYHHGLKVVTPTEMKGVVWRKDWSPQELAVPGFYHPVKRIDTHPALRKPRQAPGGQS